MPDVKWPVDFASGISHLAFHIAHRPDILPRTMDRFAELVAGIVASLTPLDEELDRVLAEVAGSLSAEERERWVAEARAALAERREVLAKRVEPLLGLLRDRLGLATRQDLADLAARVDRLERGGGG